MDKQEKIVCAAVSLYVIPLENCHAQPFDHIFKVIDYEDYKEEDLYRNLEVLDDPVFGFFTSKKRFVDAKEAMKIAVKSGQYPDYEFRKKVCLHEIEEANENKKHNQENIGFDGQLYVADIGYLENKIKEYDSLLERDYLKPEDLY